MPNIIYIATSIDGYIARTDGSIDWLLEQPNPSGSDYGFADFMDRIDGIIMGRATFDIVNAFDEWAYTKPVFVLTNTLTQLTGKWASKCQIVKGDIKDILDELGSQRIKTLYIDGGKTIQSFLKEDLIDEMVITRIPVLLGSGIPLFTDDLPELKFEHTATDIYDNILVKSSYVRKR